MSESEPEYTPTIDGLYEFIEGLPEIPDDIKDYLMHKRRLVISELRFIERKLGCPQSIPERKH